MAHIKQVKEIPLKDLVIGLGQVRLRDTGKEISELADSIRKVGLLEPIVVAPAAKAGKYEIITGQRRFLAHQELKKKTILAAVLDKKVDEMTAKVLSVTENLVRRDLNSKDLIDACTALFKKYGSIKAVCQETGLPHSKVSVYVKYDRLRPEMKALVDQGSVDVKAALRAQDAASVTGKYEPREAVTLAKEMSTMSGAQRANLAKKREEDPTVPVEQAIEEAKTGAKITQIIVTLGAVELQSLKNFAKDEGSTQDDAARTLITEALSSKGYLQE
jgi:ParB family transcriptional regulator, chromosome partitioning protein